MTMFNVYQLVNRSIIRGSGSYVWDDTGQKYLDLYGGHAVISIGHAHPHWVQRITHQLQTLPFYSNSVIIPLQTELAHVLGTISGKEDYQLFMSNSGAEANENALKLASFHNGRDTVIAFRGSFHGRTSLAAAVTDNASNRAPVNYAGNVIVLPFNNIQATEACFQNNRDSIAAVIVEGIQGVGGIHSATAEFLHSLRTLCTRHNTVLIADEVQCGYGRTGNFFYFDRVGVTADIYTTAKGMGNGFPVAGTIISPNIRPRYGMLGTTFGGNPLACTAALAVLEVLQAEHLMQNATNIGTQLQQQLRQIPEIQNVRGSGLMIGFDVPDSLLHLRNTLLTNQNIFTGSAGTNTLRLLPALSLTMRDADDFILALKTELRNGTHSVPRNSNNPDAVQ